MIEQDLKKKKRGLLSLPEMMGIDQTSEYHTPSAPKPGLLSDEDQTGGETVADKVRNRMTGRV